MSGDSNPHWRPPEGFVSPVPIDRHDPPPPPPPPAPPPVVPQPWPPQHQQPHTFVYPPPPANPYEPWQAPPAPWPPPNQSPPPGYWQVQPQPWQAPPEATAPTPPPESRRLKLVTVALVVVILMVIAAGMVLDGSSSSSRGRIFSGDSERKPADGHYVESAVDGRSSLPGDRVTVEYQPMIGQREWIHRDSIDAPDDGSTWWLSRRIDGANNGVALAYFVYKPPFDTAARLSEFRDRTYAKNASRAQGEVEFSRPTIAGREAYVYEFSTSRNMRILNAWLVGAVHTYLFECRIDPAATEEWNQCRSMLKTLTIHE